MKDTKSHRLPYNSPELRSLGSVTELTKADLSHGSDGGEFPYCGDYVSLPGSDPIPA
jgi:hypothetical protein